MRMIIVNIERPRAVTFCRKILSRCRNATAPGGISNVTPDAQPNGEH